MSPHNAQASTNRRALPDGRQHFRNRIREGLPVTLPQSARLHADGGGERQIYAQDGEPRTRSIKPRESPGSSVNRNVEHDRSLLESPASYFGTQHSFAVTSLS
jgi:hypothetical protein